MYFVGDDGTQFIESRHDRSRPAEPRPRLRADDDGRLPCCSRARAASLMLGLGGGGMSNYLRARFPELEIDAVDIDPEVVRLAQEFFDVPKDDPPATASTRPTRGCSSSARPRMSAGTRIMPRRLPRRVRALPPQDRGVLPRLPGPPRAGRVVVANRTTSRACPARPRDHPRPCFPQRYSFVSETRN